MKRSRDHARGIGRAAAAVGLPGSFALPLLLVSTLLLNACDSGTAPRVPAEVVPAMTGAALSGTAGSPLAVAPAVLVSDAGGKPLPGVTVTFAVAAGGGMVEKSTATTDANGSANAGTWTLGTTAGMNDLTATVGGLVPAHITAEGRPGAPARIERVQGDAQTATAAMTVPLPPAVRVSDEYGNAVPGVTVTFSVLKGGGSLAGATPVTNAAGVATAGAWRLGVTPGENAVRASTADLTTDFHATGKQAVPARIEAVGGSGQQAIVATAVPVAPAVRVTDAAGIPVPGLPVRFAGPAGTGRLSGVTSAGNAEQVDSLTVSTDTLGIARLTRWVLGTRAGSYDLTASAASLPPVEFNATGTPGAPVRLEATAGNGQVTIAGTAVPDPPAVTIFDAYDNPVADVSVAFVPGAGGGSVEPGTVVSNGSGVAVVTRWTLGATQGSYKLEASAGSLAPVTFTGTAIVTVTPPTIWVLGGNGQSAAAGSTLPQKPSVIVRDPDGIPLPGIAVTFAVAEGGGSIANAQQLTNAAGIATAGEWTLGTDPGTNRVTATATGIGSVSFTATGTGTTGGGGPGGGGGSGGSGGSGAFSIELRYLTVVPASAQAALHSAVSRWSAVIRGDVPDAVVNVPAGCGPALNEVVDDMILFVKVAAIDGPRNVLGSAGPCYVRVNGRLPIVGIITLDQDDINFMESQGLLDDVVKHEIGHTLGIGTNWGSLLTGRGGPDPYFTGSGAVASFRSHGGGSYAGNVVPVENAGAAGSRDGHWRESVMRGELMTSTISSGGNPLSAITVSSLADLGYNVDLSAASSYTVPSGGAGTSNAFGLPRARIELVEGKPPAPVAIDSRGRPMQRRR